MGGVRGAAHSEERRDLPSTATLQAPVSACILGGDYVAADFLTEVLTDKSVCHIPEYRRVKTQVFPDL